MPFKLITDYLELNAAKSPGKTALITDERTFNWSQLNDEVDRLCPAFYSKGDTQEIYGILMPNTWQFVVTYLAILKAGHIAMPLDVIYKTMELDAITRQLKPTLIVSDQAGKSRISGDVEVVGFDDLKIGKPGKSLRQAPDKQIATLLFTSGTTGKPKAVPHTHQNHIWNIIACSDPWSWNSEHIQLLSLRLSHWYGACMGLAGAIYHGNTTYLVDGFDAAYTLQRLASGEITLFTHTPIAYKKMLEVKGNFDLSKVDLLISGSAPLPPSIWEEFSTRFNNKIIETYGSSETGRIAANPASDPRPGSPGFLLREVEARLDQSSELLIKSPGIFPGYFNNQEATKNKLTADGFWRTGDIAELEGRRVILKGRTQERIRRHGYSLSPRDIEWALLQDERISECAVIGAPGDETDDQLIYFIVGDISDEELVNHQKQNLPSIWRATKIIRLDNLPRTPRGKVDLEALRVMVN